MSIVRQTISGVSAVKVNRILNNAVMSLDKDIHINHIGIIINVVGVMRLEITNARIYLIAAPAGLNRAFDHPLSMPDLKSIFNIMRGLFYDDSMDSNLGHDDHNVLFLSDMVEKVYDLEYAVDYISNAVLSAGVCLLIERMCTETSRSISVNCTKLSFVDKKGCSQEIYVSLSGEGIRLRSGIGALPLRQNDDYTGSVDTITNYLRRVLSD